MQTIKFLSGEAWQKQFASAVRQRVNEYFKEKGISTKRNLDATMGLLGSNVFNRFQIEHHLFPTICHVHYRHIAPIVERTVGEFGLFYNLRPSFSAALGSHIDRLKELGQSIS